MICKKEWLEETAVLDRNPVDVMVDIYTSMPENNVEDLDEKRLQEMRDFLSETLEPLQHVNCRCTLNIYVSVPSDQIPSMKFTNRLYGLL